MDEDLEPKERIAKQRQKLNKKIGIDFMDMKDLISDDDLSAPIISIEERQKREYLNPITEGILNMY